MFLSSCPLYPIRTEKSIKRVVLPARENTESRIIFLLFMVEEGKLSIPTLPVTAYTTQQVEHRKTLEEKKKAERTASKRKKESRHASVLT